MTTLLANFEKERKAFKALLEPDCRRRILLFQGASGIGKTWLLTSCVAGLPKSVVHIPMHLRPETDISDVFFRSADCLDWKRLPRFKEELARLQGGAMIQITDNKLIGSQNSIQVALNADILSDREHRRALLTAAWFEDVRNIDFPTVVTFDVYEKATTEVQSWIAGPFLARVAGTQGLRVVVAGQSVPTANNIEWGHCCESYSLSGVPDPEQWMPVVKAMRRRTLNVDPHSFLKVLCFAFKGHPGGIMQALEMLPRAEISDDQ